MVDQAEARIGIQRAIESHKQARDVDIASTFGGVLAIVALGIESIPECQLASAIITGGLSISVLIRQYRSLILSDSLGRYPVPLDK